MSERGMYDVNASDGRDSVRKESDCNSSIRDFQNRDVSASHHVVNNMVPG